MQAPRPFQIILYFGFGLLMAAALVLIVNPPSGGGTTVQRTGPVTIWGTIDRSVMDTRINEFRSRESRSVFESVRYRQIREEDFNTEVVSAIAERRQPDLIIIPHRLLMEHRSIIQPIAYTNPGYSRRELRDAYLDGFEIFEHSNGLYAIPLAVDPLVMYWNRDIFANNGFSQPPQTWEEVVNNIVPTIVRRTVDRRITMSPVALGVYDNNRNAFAFLSTLLLQGGSQLITEDRGQLAIQLNTARPGGQPNPMVAAVNFFTRFADPGDTLYSWNRTKQLDRQEFLAEDLAIYFGLGSEYPELRRQNPNLNFDIARVPQSADATIQRTYGDFYGIAILQAAPNRNGAQQVAGALGTLSVTRTLAQSLNFAPPHRASIGAGSQAPAEQVVFSSALVARGWLNPRWQRTDDIFRQLIADVQAGRINAANGVRDTLSRLRQAF